MLRIAVCDDELIFQNRISDMIKAQLGKCQIECDISCFQSGEDLVEASKQQADFEVVFLDVNMEKMDGIETAKILRLYSPEVYIVFVTAFITYALDGYRVNAIRYLMKNEDNFEDSLRECLDTIIEKMDYRERRVTFEFQSGRADLPADRILYVESRLHKSIFYVLENGIKEYYLYEKLDTIQEQLKDKGFCRVHQSFLVNMKHVRKVERYTVTLSDGSKISVSKKYYKTVENEYIRWRGDI